MPAPPQARVLVVGYPDGLPQNGTNCYPVVPFSDADVSWFNSLQIDLNSVLAQRARRGEHGPPGGGDAELTGGTLQR